LIILIIVVGAGSTALFLSGLLPAGRVVGSGTLVTDEKDFRDFTAISVGYGFNVKILQSSSYSVSITTDDNMAQYVKVSKTGTTLTIGLKSGSYQSITLKAEITLPELHGLELSGGTRGQVNDFTFSHEFSLELSGGSRIEIEGEGTDLVIDASGGSQLDLEAFPVRHAEVNLSGGSRATIRLDGRLDADLSGGSVLLYIGAPTMGDIHTSGGSTISRK
jgi:hypothetical protein